MEPPTGVVKRLLVEKVLLELLTLIDVLVSSIEGTNEVANSTGPVGVDGLVETPTGARPPIEIGVLNYYYY